MNKKDSRPFLRAALMLTAALSLPAVAEPVVADNGTIEEIVVTAQRRAQSLQEVPVAVSSLDGDYLASRQIQSIEKLSSLAPSFKVSKGPTDAAATVITIRGAATSNQGILFDPAVGVYVDNVFVGKAYGSVFDLPDLERVEVLRGPQGTLYGRNTLAGAVNLVTRKPSDSFRAEGEVTYGNLDYKAIKGLVNVPLTQDLYVKASGQFRQRDGFTRYTADGILSLPTIVDKDGGDNLDRTVADLQVRYRINDKVTGDYNYTYSRVQEHPATVLAGYDAGGILDPASPFYIGAPVHLYVNPNPYRRPATLSVNNQQYQDVEVQGHSLTLTADLDAATLKSITAYRKMDYDMHAPDEDIDGSPFLLAGGGFNTKYDAFSQELQASGTLADETLNYVAGAFYYRDNGQSSNPQTYFFGASAFDTRLGGQTESYAFYGQADYKLVDTLTLTAGLRYTHERKRVQRFYQILAQPGLPGLPLTVMDIDRDDDVHANFSKLSPTAIVAWEPMENLNVYAKYSKGYRSGGFNGEATTVADVSTPYEAETNTSYEVGIKSQLLGRRLLVNAAAYHNIESNKQLSVFSASSTAATLIRNAGRARVQGVEAEIQARPTDALTLTASYGYVSQRYRQFLDMAAGVTVDVANNRVFAQAPKTTASAGIDLRLWEGIGEVHASGDMAYRSSYYTLIGQKQADPRFPLITLASDVRVPSVTTFNAQLRWIDVPMGDNGTFYATLWGENLSNENKPTAFIKFPASFGGMLVGNYMDGRTYGLTIGVRF